MLADMLFFQAVSYIATLGSPLLVDVISSRVMRLEGNTARSLPCCTDDGALLRQHSLDAQFGRPPGGDAGMLRCMRLSTAMQAAGCLCEITKDEVEEGDTDKIMRRALKCAHEVHTCTAWSGQIHSLRTKA